MAFQPSPQYRQNAVSGVDSWLLTILVVAVVGSCIAIYLAGTPKWVAKLSQQTPSYSLSNKGKRVEIAKTRTVTAPNYGGSNAKPAGDATHSVSNVYYGTNRTRRSPFDAATIGDVLQLLASLVLAWLALIFSMRKRPIKTSLCLACSICLTVVTLIGIDFLTLRINRQATHVYGDGHGELEYGVCSVSIPFSHEAGAIETPSLLHFEIREDPAKHIVIQGVDITTRDSFCKSLKDAVAGDGSSVLLFIHGYNVSFDDAIRRAAQLCHDLELPVVPVVYSWPSRGTVLSYTIDEESAKVSTKPFVDFLTALRESCSGRPIHVVAHSMGNRCLGEAMKELSSVGGRLFDQCVLAAPDIGKEDFTKGVAKCLIAQVNRLTLYGSERDRALKASKLVHGGDRAGSGGSDIVVVEGMESVEASKLETDFLNHSYFGSNSNIISDLKDLFGDRKPASQRAKMVASPPGQNPPKYWTFDP